MLRTKQPTAFPAVFQRVMMSTNSFDCAYMRSKDVCVQDNGEDDWMTRYFFTGGTMPSLDLFLYFQDDLQVSKVAYINGVHYSRCLEAWLQLQDQRRRSLMPVFVVRTHTLPALPTLARSCRLRVCTTSH